MMNRTVLSVLPPLLLTLILALNTAQAGNIESEFKPFVKGSFQQILQENQQQPYIIAFWSVTCAYCMKELALFGRLMPQYPGVKLITITTDAFMEDVTVLALLEKKKLQGTETWVYADNYVERLHHDVQAGWQGELPLTYFFDQQNKMIRHMGIVKEQELVDWLQQQSQN